MLCCMEEKGLPAGWMRTNIFLRFRNFLMIEFFFMILMIRVLVHRGCCWLVFNFSCFMCLVRSWLLACVGGEIDFVGYFFFDYIIGFSFTVCTKLFNFHNAFNKNIKKTLDSRHTRHDDEKGFASFLIRIQHRLCNYINTLSENPLEPFISIRLMWKFVNARIVVRIFWKSHWDTFFFPFFCH